MMGFKERAFAPLVAVSLEELVPQDHFYRHVQTVLDLSFVYELVRECYPMAGRPSIDPVVFFKLQLVMFFEDVRSERLLMRQVADRLSVRWYVGYDLDEPLPDHSTLSKIRLRYGLEVFRRFFEAIVEQCQQARLVWGRELYFDSTQVNANADLDSLAPRFAVEAREALQEHLAALFEPEASQPENGEEQSANVLASERQVEATLIDEPVSLPTRIAEARREELSEENTARHDWIEQEGRQQRDVYGSYQRTADFRISTTDPDATPMRLKGGGIHLGYHTHYVVDGGKRRIILAVLVVPGEVMDNQPMLDLLWHVLFRWRNWPNQVTGDMTYGTAENIKAIEDAHIHAYIPLAERGQRTGYYGLADFTYDPVHDHYTCPQGQFLIPFHREEQTQVVEYRAVAGTCNLCPVKAACTTNKRGRHIHRSFFADYLDRVKAYAQTLACHKALNKRKVWIEPLFGEGKQWHGMRRFRLRRLWRVNCEALVIASGQNLKRLLQKRGWGRRPFPTEAMAMRPPAKRETEASFSTSTRTPPRRAVAVTFTTLFHSSTPCFPTRKGWFFSLSHSFSLHATRKSIFVSLRLLFSGFSFFRGERAGHFLADPCT
jgi:transposase